MSNEAAITAIQRKSTKAEFKTAKSLLSVEFITSNKFIVWCHFHDLAQLNRHFSNFCKQILPNETTITVTQGKSTKIEFKNY